ncbi:protealysin inhibitor emfourin [Streptomyces sp. NPDC093252]|uniref:protealysin inhibitor emfourin n=1 Tax=Streptomyces sp. NPDC093252 TaxID=3154980 RepID=UPI00342464C3
MRIQVRRTGGFAGIERHAEVDTSGRPDAAEWQALAERAVAAGRGTPPGGGPHGVPDGFSYEITVDGRTVRCADPRLTDEQRELVRRVLKEGA